MQGASFLFTITPQSLHLVQATVAEWDQYKTGVHISSGSIITLFSCYFLHVFFSVSLWLGLGKPGFGPGAILIMMFQRYKIVHFCIMIFFNNIFGQRDNSLIKWNLVNFFFYNVASVMNRREFNPWSLHPEWILWKDSLLKVCLRPLWGPEELWV